MSPHAADVDVELNALPPLETLHALWRAVETRGEGSFFLSWAWISAWLSLCRLDASYRLLCARRKGNVVGLAIFRQVGFELYLHQCGDSVLDSVFIEYNGFLVTDAAVREAMFTFLARTRGWSTLHIAGADRATAEAALDTELHDGVRRRICPWIDLEALAPGLDGYLGVLSANTRQQIRRSLRLCMDMRLEVVRRENAAPALAQLQALHESAWLQRNGTRGAFACAHFAPFIRTLAQSPGVDLLRVTAGGECVGILLNFTHAGHVYAYQSGLNYTDDNRFKPGLMSHAMAVAHYREQGMHAYHFMAGEGQYKRSLGTKTEELAWMTLRPPGAVAFVQHYLTSFRKRIAERAARIKL